MSSIVGIDLGTTFSAIAYVDDNGVPRIIPNGVGDRLTPSVILYDNGTFIVGKAAKENALAIPEQTVEFIKRAMGRPVTEYVHEFGGKQYSPEELSAEILKTLKSDAETALNDEVTGAVITVPAYFNDSERQATIRSGEIAGFNVERIINEPTAAALAYGMQHIGDRARILVFDLGGGTFDVTIMEIDGQDMRILATDGDHRLGGKDWDDKIIEYAADTFQSEHGRNPLEDAAAYHNLQARVVDAKMSLSTLNRTRIVTDYAGNSQALELTRETFEEITADLVERCKSTVDLVLHEINLKKSDIDTVLLVGGSTRMPMIRDMLTQHFGKEPDTSVNPDEAVVFGAAVMGEIIVSERTPRLFLEAAPRPQFGLMRISDVCSHDLGMVVLDENGQLTNSVIIDKNTNIPCKVSRDNYMTQSANQTEFDVIVLQGPRELAPRDCPVHDAYEVYNIPSRPAGQTRIKVTFEYNTDGVIKVGAEDVNTETALPTRKKVEEIDWDALESPEPERVPMDMDIALVIDCSVSMAGESLSDAKSAACRFLDNIDPSSSVGLVSFGSTAEIKMCLTRDFGQLRGSIEALGIEGSTAMDQGIALTRDLVLGDSGRVKVLILLTDGHPNDADTTVVEANLAKDRGIRIIAIGVGFGVDSDYLQMISSTPEDYHFVTESSHLGAAFTTIAGRLLTESSERPAGIMRV